MNAAPSPSDEGLLLAWRREFLTALGFFTRLPVATRSTGSLAAAARAFPLVGLVVGGIGAGFYAIAVVIGLSPLPSAFLALAATAVLTGALHEDGLADCCDALGARGDRERKLAIMRDSRIGSFGALALIIATGMKAAAMAALGTAEPAIGAFILAHVLARGLLPWLMIHLPPARADGLGHAAGKPDRRNALQASLLCLAAAFLLLPPIAALGALAAALIAHLGVGLLADRHLGGQTGDVLGAAEQAAEIAILIAVGPLL